MLEKPQIEFRDRVIVLSKKIGPQYSIDWRLMAAVAILETGWGTSELARCANNFFGIKPSSVNHEVYVFKRGRFRKFDFAESSFHAYGWLMSQSSHYASARRAARQAAIKEFVECMAPVYCPPDPEYATNIKRLITMVDKAANQNERG